MGAVLEVQLSDSGLACETDCESGESSDDERRSENSEGARSVAVVYRLKQNSQRKENGANQSAHGKNSLDAFRERQSIEANP